MFFGTGCGYSQIKVDFYSVMENYLETVNTADYYIVTEVSDKANKLEAVKMLYQNSSSLD